jgi:DNA-binding NarL/FixJ family response regulator
MLGQNPTTGFELVRERTQVFVSACDSVSRDGIASQLRGNGIELVDERRLDSGVVAVIVVDEVVDETAHEIRRLRRSGVDNVVVVATRMDDMGLLAAVQAGANGVLRRGDSTPQSLLQCVHAAAAGEGSLPPDMLGRLLSQVGSLQRQVLSPRGLTFSGLTQRELTVLQLLSEGFTNAEVGRRIFLSERTVRNVVHELTARLNLRNRTHAVAYAVRQGLI